LDIERFNEVVATQDPETYPETYEALFESMAAASGHFDGDFQEVRPASVTVL
jgi:hypothetical protein